MTGKPDTCAGCAYTAMRLRHSKPSRFCTRYRQARDVRCLDYRSQPSAIKASLDYLKRIGK